MNEIKIIRCIHTQTLAIREVLNYGADVRGAVILMCCHGCSLGLQSSFVNIDAVAIAKHLKENP